MRKLALIALVIQLTFISCEKEHEKDAPCPVVSETEVPVVVKTAFTGKYSKLSADKWYDVGRGIYCAYFISNGVKTFAHFQSDGTYIERKSKGQNGHQDDDAEEEGCEIDD